MAITKRKFGKTLRKMLTASALWLMPATAAFADVTLVESPLVDDHLVRLSDLFEGLEANGDTIIMHAPDPGQRDTISGYELSQIAETYEIDWIRPNYIRRVYIERSGEAFTLNDVQPVLIEMIKDNGINTDIDVQVYGRESNLYLPLGYSTADINFTDFQINDRADRFSVTLDIPTGSPERKELRVSGSITEVRTVPVLNRMVTPGEVISKNDISWEKFPVRRINRNVVLSSKDLIGQTVRRAINGSQMIRESDITMPVVVSRGSLVTMTFANGALTLTAQARALEDGGNGEVIRVMNDRSNQTLQAKVIGPANVIIQPTLAQQLATNN